MFMPQPDPSLIGVFAILGLHLVAMYTGLGGFALAWTCETLSDSGGKVFLKKMAQQFSALGLLFLCYILVSVVGALAVFHFRYPELLQPWLEAPLLAAPIAGSLAFFTVFGVAYALTWGLARRNAGAHRVLGMLAAMGLVGLLTLSLAVKLVVLSNGTLGTFDFGPEGIATSLRVGIGHPLFLPLCLTSLFLALTCAGGVGLVYLLMRRTRDDFGRDHYAYATRFTSRFAALNMVCAACVQGWAASFMHPEQILARDPSFTGWLLIGGAGCAIAALICWLSVGYSKAPLRLKPLMILAVVFLIGAVAGFSAADATVFMPPSP